MVSEEESVLNHFFYEIKRGETFNEFLTVVKHSSEHYKKEHGIVSVKKQGKTLTHTETGSPIK